MAAGKKSTGRAAAVKESGELPGVTADAEPVARCGDCRFYVRRTEARTASENQCWERLGECRRYPDGVTRVQGDWCGEFTTTRTKSTKEEEGGTADERG